MPYATEREARLRIRDMSKTGSKHGRPEVYRCQEPGCVSYHIGHHRKNRHRPSPAYRVIAGELDAQNIRELAELDVEREQLEAMSGWSDDWLVSWL